MKILFAGNVANVGYTTAKFFQQKNIIVDLLMEKDPPLVIDPVKQDSTLKMKYPHWIKFYNKKNILGKFYILNLMRNKKYDLIHAHYGLVIYAYLSRRPFIAQIVGSDLRELAFSNSFRGILMRRALKKAKIVIFTSPLDKILLQKLNIHKKIFVPIIWDTDFFKQENSKESDNSNLTIFHPANLNWKIKGNDILINGFAEFVKTSPNSTLKIVDRGTDSENTHRLVKKLRLEDKVQFIKGPLNYKELKKTYLLSDIVADQFVLSGVGGIACESLACEKPVLGNCPPNIYQDLHDEGPPIFHCENSNDVLKNLQILKNKKLRKDVGLKGRDWVVKHHSPKFIFSKIELIYNMIFQGKNHDEISKKIKDN
jgi:glycosyltransferase involved in cell wall biosynthesis